MRPTSEFAGDAKSSEMKLDQIKKSRSIVTVTFGRHCHTLQTYALHVTSWSSHDCKSSTNNVPDFVRAENGSKALSIKTEIIENN
jgi:hypothetical protein